MNGQPLRADALRNRQAILTAARELVAARGPEVGMDQIAAAADVAVGTLYRHFPAKKDLIEAIAADLVDGVGESLDAVLDAVENGAAEGLDALVALFRRVVIDLRQERLFRLAVTGVADESLREIQRRGRAAVERLVAAAHGDGALYPDVTADDVVLLLSAAPVEPMPEAEQRRWLILMRRALTPP